MTVWWGLAGLLGLLGLCGLIRGHRADGTVVEDDPLARYPAAREPVLPNADAAHTPLMTPAITPEMLARPELPRPEPVGEGRMAGEIPAPRPQSGGPGVPAGVSVGWWGEAASSAAPGVSEGTPGRAQPAAEIAVPGVSDLPRQGVPPANAHWEQAPAGGVPRHAAAGPAPEWASARPNAVQSTADPVPDSAAAQENPAGVRAPQQPKHALPVEAGAPESTFTRQSTPAPESGHGAEGTFALEGAPVPESAPASAGTFAPEGAPVPENPRAAEARPQTDPQPKPAANFTSPPPERNPGLIGKLRRLFQRS
ncbi:hypothetical protein [Amycolatopsis sp. NPDC004169]|uniref:hypothetical protein n=1 Tax=Amycolatopsis sp. NPDC004169 TaxID=3154453 RepID=UPI0033BB49E4